MMRQSPRHRGYLHKSAKKGAVDYFAGLIICPSNRALTSAAEHLQPAKATGEGGFSQGAGRGMPEFSFLPGKSGRNTRGSDGSLSTDQPVGTRGLGHEVSIWSSFAGW